ncbi:MAG: class I SAM-dependent methyltransferase [Sandarakinorhabdus sp.]|nr:class I SAM-dependent methyltransferase [Sandarakinorhabdus sp.]
MPDFDTALRSAREFARHSLYRLGLRKTADPRVTGSLADRFTGIYEQGIWTEGRADVPGSGAGSTMDATATLRARLPALLTELDATSLLDVGCGDLHWMSKLQLPCPYLGIDIVPAVIARNTAEFGSETRRFAVANAVADALAPADVILCREVIFHLSFADARALLRNLLTTGCRWIMLTSDSATLFNADIESGGARILNLEIAPFRLGPPAQAIIENESYRGRRIGVWSAAQVAAALG